MAQNGSYDSNTHPLNMDAPDRRACVAGTKLNRAALGPSGVVTLDTKQRDLQHKHKLRFLEIMANK